MSKIFKPFAIFFRAIYRLIDKFIITPVSRLIYKISEFSKEHSGKLEKILNRPNVLIYLSLICAISIFLLIDSQVINLTEREAEVISDQPVKVVYNEEAYIVEGVPEAVDIILIGSKSTTYIARQLGNHEVLLDLSSYGPGTYKVKLKYNHSSQAINYKLDPSTVTVKISEKISRVMPLTYDVMNEEKLDSKLSISNVKLETNEVIIKSSQEILNRVATVKALIDASQIDLKESGDFTVESVTLAAYDELGNKLDNIEMVPSKVSAKVTIDSYHATKPVRVITKGEMSNGKAIASVVPSVREVEVYGEKAIVDALDYVYAELQVDNITGDKSVSINLKKPTGIRYMSETTTNVSVTVGEASQKTITGVTVTVKENTLGLDYSASAINENNKTIDVIVKGVKSVIDEIDSTQVKATIDLSGLKPGTHTLKVTVTVNDEKISVQPIQTEVTVKIVEK